MKKNLTKITGIALASLSLLLVGCPKPTDEPEKIEPTVYPDSDAVTLHEMILPHGTEATIAPWTKAGDALATDLPEFVTSFSDYKKIKVIKQKTLKETTYNTQELNGKTNRTAKLKEEIQKAIDNNSFAGRKPKNVIIIFGDGMGESHIVASRKYYGDLIMDMLPYHTPINHDSYLKPGKGDLPKTTCTDSSAGGTAIVTGFKTRYGYIGLDANGTPVKNLAELAREKGMLVGNVTNDHMGDATPADVSIHDINRDYQNQIYGKLFFSSPDIAMGSDYGYSDFIQEGKTGSERATIEDIFAEKDEDTVKDLKKDSDYKDIWEVCSKEASLKLWYEDNATYLQKWAINMLNKYDGKSITDSTYDFNNWAADRNMHTYNKFTDLISAVQADYSIRAVSKISYEAKYDYTSGIQVTAPKFGYKLGYGSKNTTLPSYPEMVAATLSVLDHKSKANNDCGFYCLIENTVSDGWGHASQPYDCMNEIQCFDEGLAIALKYVLENPDTLLVVTADHETGGLTYKKNWDTNYKKIQSTTSGHSTEPVPLLAFGAGADIFPKRIAKSETDKWTADDWASYVAGTKVTPVQNRQTGIWIAQAMGYEHFGDLNANGVLDPETEYDSMFETEDHSRVVVDKIQKLR